MSAAKHTPWAVFERRAVERARAGESGSTSFTWVEAGCFRRHSTRWAAIRAVALFVCGLPADSPDWHIRNHWARYRSNVGDFRISKVTGGAA